MYVNIIINLNIRLRNKDGNERIHPFDIIYWICTDIYLFLINLDNYIFMNKHKIVIIFNETYALEKGLYILRNNKTVAASGREKYNKES